MWVWSKRSISRQQWARCLEDFLRYLCCYFILLGRDLYDDLLGFVLLLIQLQERFQRPHCSVTWFCNYWGKNRKREVVLSSDSNFWFSYDLSPEDANQLLVICKAYSSLDTTFCVPGGTKTKLLKLGNFYSTDSDKSETQCIFKAKSFLFSWVTQLWVPPARSRIQLASTVKHLGIFDLCFAGFLYFVPKIFLSNSKIVSIKLFIDRVLDAAILKDEHFSIPAFFDSMTITCLISSSITGWHSWRICPQNILSRLLSIREVIWYWASPQWFLWPLPTPMRTLLCLGFLLMDHPAVSRVSSRKMERVFAMRWPTVVKNTSFGRKHFFSRQTQSCLPLI